MTLIKIKIKNIICKKTKNIEIYDGAGVNGRIFISAVLEYGGILFIFAFLKKKWNLFVVFQIAKAKKVFFCRSRLHHRKILKSKLKNFNPKY